MTSSTPKKPTRVMTDDVHVANCPVCETVLTGIMSVEVYVDGVDITYDDDGAVTSSSKTTTRVRGLDMPAHRCRPAAAPQET